MARSTVMLASLAIGAMGLAGCSSSASTDTAESAPADRGGAVNNETTTTQNFETFLNQNVTGTGFMSVITGGYPDTTVSCDQDGVGANPIVIVNNTGTEQWFNVTDNPVLANQVLIVPLPPAGSTTVDNCPGSEVMGSQAVSVPPGATVAALLMAGGYQGPNSQLIGDEHNLSIGGGQSGNTQWYDLWLHFGPTNDFENWELGYSNTGGLMDEPGTPDQNTQPGLFNAVQCSTSGSGTSQTISIDNVIITPWGSNSNRWQYNKNDPICFGFFDSDANVAQEAA